MGSEATAPARPNGADPGAAAAARGTLERAYGQVVRGENGPTDPDRDAAAARLSESAGAGTEAGAELEDASARSAAEGPDGPGAGEGAAAAAESGAAEASGAAEGEDAAAGSAEAGSFRSLDELVAAAELDDDAAGALEVRVKVDGRESTVPLSDLVASYQIRSAAEQRLAEAKDRAKSVTEQLHQKSSEAETRLVQAGKLLERAEEQLQRDTKSIDWAHLREDDPADYSAKKLEIQERRDEIEKLKREAVESYEQATQKQREEALKQQQERVRQETQALLEKIPEWKDREKAKSGWTELSHYLNQQGFSAEEVNGAGDHRLILLARKAMLYDKGRNGAAQKKVTKAAKPLRPGARASGKPAAPRKPKDKVELFYGSRA